MAEIMSLESSHSVDILTSRFAKFSEQDKERDSLIYSLLDRITECENKIKRLHNDLEDQTESRIKWQEDARSLREEKKKLVHMIGKDVYVVVLIDGDGAKFLDSLLQDPIGGAAEAGLRLKRAVREYLKDTPLGTEDVPILVRIYANLNGLAKSLRLSNIINSDDDMRTFAEQFTISHAEFDFVNVGHGKENADSKMGKMFNYFYKNLQCKKIFFAGCHDNGYLHVLRERRGDPEAEERIILLETTPAQPSFTQLNFAMTRFDNVFSSVPLGNERKHSIPLSPTQTQAPSVSVKPLAPSFVETDLHGASKPSLAAPSSPPTAIVTSSGNGGISVRYPNYAAAGGVNGHQNISIHATQAKAKYIEYNKNNSRLDPLNKHPGNTLAQVFYKQKCENIKPSSFCNEYYLGGRCEYGESCNREHRIKLTPGEIAIHRYKARTSLCTTGPSCGNYNCHFSHHCPFGPSCNRRSECKFSNTRFGDLHLTQDELKAVTRFTEGREFPDHL